MVSMNIFRILGDVCHALSKCILIYAIHSNSSAEGVSLITQALYCLVFLSRYTDYFSAFGYSWWNTIWKTFYILSSFYVLFIMMRIYARTREREKAWKFGAACLIGSAILAPICMLIFRKKAGDQLSWGWIELFWIFSIILESVCVLPQLLLLRQTTVPTVLDSFYLLTLGSYRALYILNWIVREFDTNGRKPDAISIIFGVIQTAFYIDFAWVYYSRQRVKLRHGGLVDSDDLRQGWILRRVFGHKAVAGSIDDEADEESAPALGANGEPTPGRGTKWGTRGISVQADDGVLEAERERQGRSGYPGQENGVIDTADEGMEDAQLRDPDELMLDSDDDDGTLPSAGVDGVKNGSEWREGQK